MNAANEDLLSENHSMEPPPLPDYMPPCITHVCVPSLQWNPLWVAATELDEIRRSQNDGQHGAAMLHAPCLHDPSFGFIIYAYPDRDIASKRIRIEVYHWSAKIEVVMWHVQDLEAAYDLVQLVLLGYHAYFDFTPLVEELNEWHVQRRAKTPAV